MGKATKTDNDNLAAKLELRRHFLSRYHADADLPDVLDCCQGSGAIWNRLRQEFRIARYWGVDVKPKKGRLKIDSARILSQTGWPFNVVDVDTYGTPWKHWLALLPNVTRPLTVFLTCGRVFTGGALPLAEAEAEAIGMKFPTLKPPGSFTPKLCELAVNYLLNRVHDSGIIITEAVEAVSSGNARYLGVRLEKANGQGTTNPIGRSEHGQATKENGHV